MITKNYAATAEGKLVASGPGVATVSTDSIVSWAIGDSDTTAPAIRLKHTLKYSEKDSMDLADGEHLWIYGVGTVAVTAENPAAGDI